VEAVFLVENWALTKGSKEGNDPEKWHKYHKLCPRLSTTYTNEVYSCASARWCDAVNINVNVNVDDEHER